MLAQLVLVAVLSQVAHSIVCPSDVCQSVQCSPVTSCNGLVVSGAGFCGCCDRCVTLLGEGEMCVSSLLLGAPAHSVCEPHLTCDVNTLTCQRTQTQRATLTCAEKKAQMNGNSLLGQQHLDCNPDGSYKPKQCKGSECYCVDAEGKDIGYHINIGESKTMNCQCARDFDAYKKTGLIGRLFHCAPNGNYQQYRCTGSACYCIDDYGNQLGTKSVSIGSLDSLDCTT